jgi:hypothetical protein
MRTGLIFGGICGIVGAALAGVTLRAAQRAPLPLDETRSSLRAADLAPAEADVGSREVTDLAR